MFSYTLKGHQNQATLFERKLIAAFQTLLYSTEPKIMADNYTKWQQLNE